MNYAGLSTALGVAVVVVLSSFAAFGQQIAATPSADAQSIQSPSPRQASMDKHPFIGMWVTKDGRIRQELLPNGRYDEARGSKQSAYQGRYEVRGNHIDYWDDTGFTADGTFVNNDELHHGGMIFYREK